MFHRRLRVLITIFVTLCSLHGLASVGEESSSYEDFTSTIQQSVLDNGLTTLVYEDKKVRRAVCQLFIKEGSRNEYPGVTGVSHLIEHLFMPGKRPGDREGDVLARVGGSTGAHTRADYIDVIVTVPDSEVELAIRMLGNRFRDLNATAERVESEKKIIWNERLLKENTRPTLILLEKLWALAFDAHPYGNPVGGWPSDIRSVSTAEVNRFFDTYYVPRNAVLVVVGNVEREEVEVLVTRYWSDIPDRHLPDLRVTEEPLQRGPKRAVFRYPTSRPALAIGYHVPPFGSPERAALQAIIKILSAPGGRIESLFSGNSKIDLGLTKVTDQRDPTLMTIVLDLEQGTDPETAEEKFIEAVERLRSSLVSEEELLRAKNNLEMDFFSFIIHPTWTLYSLGAKAYQIGHYHVLGDDYHLLQRVLEQYQNIKREDILNAARVFLAPERRSTLLLLPGD